MTAEPIWIPSSRRVEASNMHAFMRRIEKQSGCSFSGYPDFHAWSIDCIGEFWAAAWEFLGIRASRDPQAILDDATRMPGARWFEGAELNYAENLLRRRDDDPAIIFRGEGMETSRVLSWNDLYDAVGRLAPALRSAGVEPGDRVAGFMPNIPETIIAMLATTSIGAVWSSCSPDFGVKGVLDRFARIQPTVLFTADGYRYGGRRFSSLETVEGILGGLDVTPRLVVVPFLDEEPDLSRLPGSRLLEDFMVEGTVEEIEFAQVPSDHPLFIMYSSGTTGLPKCIIQSVGGVLVNQLKELVLHTDLKRNERIFYFTTCGWMMWNWLVAALGAEATVVLFDGSPFEPDPASLWRLAAEERVSVFGTSPKYLTSVEVAGVQPGSRFDLSSLRTVLSTGSPLLEENFEYIYREVSGDVCVSSISGGTDLNGCFVGGCPMLPVYSGEIQCRCLGMDVHAWSPDGESLEDETGELVCTSAFPSMPLRFWGDEDGSAYRAAYFERFPGAWHHGDFISIASHGGIRITGRSDATLNPGGVRIGTAEIYRQVEPLEGVVDSIAIGQAWGDDERVVLFVQLEDDLELSGALEHRIREVIRTHCSPRHVPACIVAVTDIPYTISGKKVELAVRDIVHGRSIENRDTLRNPEALDQFVDLVALWE